jgi:hydrogenase maturation protein HypF
MNDWQVAGETQLAERLRVVLRGAVQGVGFRPFVYRLAGELGLVGWVSNSPRGVFLEVEGPSDRLHAFLLRLESERPAHASIQSLEYSFLPPAGFHVFEIRASDETGEPTALVLPDIATCPDCLREILDPANRRYGYPFTNCTHCGPRFSILRALPYDRRHTTMAAFPLCAACRAEYEDPTDRRFHAQPTACPTCGPHLAAWDPHGAVLAERQAALRAAVEILRQGGILALKGIGGFQLLVDARDEAAVRRLRTRKAREAKPLALLAPSLDWTRQTCRVSTLEARLLQAPEAPIVLLRRCHGGDDAVASSVAPGSPELGVMLPCSPLHHLLMRELGFPVVATSGNLSDEPICTDEREALDRLRDIADGFLVHDRPIARHVDDSVVRILLGRELVLRRARGYAPLPIRLPVSLPPTLAVGAHLKNAVAIAVGQDAFLSQHIGDLETPQAFAAYQQVVDDFHTLYALRPTRVAADAHPDYLSSRDAARRGLPVIRVQHHYAHVLACMAENGLTGPALGIAWDGTGYGLDRTIWGGEFLRMTESGFERVAHLRTFRLPGGEQAIREPRRSAIGLLHAFLGPAAMAMDDLIPVRDFSIEERKVILQALIRNLNCPVTSSVGRLFDAVAALAGLRQVTLFEGQAAMELEWALAESAADGAYPMTVKEGTGPLVLDWEPMIRALLDDLGSGVPLAAVAARFHHGLADSIVAVARRIGERTVLLSGGCFQNRYLTERAVRRLTEAGFSPHWHQRVPPNDGGIALGQLLAAARTKE